MLTQSQKQVAEVFRIALRCSCCQPEEVIAWADEIISTNLNPPYDIIEISTSTSDLVSQLSKISTDSDGDLALRVVMGRMYEIGSKAKEKLADFSQGLCQITLERENELPEDLLFCEFIEDSYMLAYSGIYGILSDIEDDLLSSLKSHWSEKSSTKYWYIL